MDSVESRDSGQNDAGGQDGDSDGSDDNDSDGTDDGNGNGGGGGGGGSSAPSGLSYSSSTALYLYNDLDGTKTADITSNSPTVTGSVTSWSISPDITAETGLSFSTATGIISGKPTASVDKNYTITATNASGNASAQITVRTAPGFVVNSNSDTAATDANTADNECKTAGNTCTLRAAIEQINAMAGGVSRVIYIPAMTITLTANLATFTTSLEVVGVSKTQAIIDGVRTYYMFYFGGDNTTLTLREITMQNAYTAGNGGAAIYGSNAARTGLTLNVDDCIIKGSYGADTSSSSRGGAVNHNKGVATFTDTTFDANGNSDTTGGHTDVSDWQVVILGGNFAHLIDRCTFKNSIGGAIMFNAGSQTVTVRNSTFSGNVVTGGDAPVIGLPGAISLVVENCTMVNNVASSGLGVIVGSNAGTVFTSRNNIFYNNNVGAGNNCGRTSGTNTSGGGNIFSPSTNCTMYTDLTDVNADPLVAALGSNGGPTETVSLGAGSPAINGGVNTNCPAVDQRGLPRPVGGTCDAGAVEVQ